MRSNPFFRYNCSWQNNPSRYSSVKKEPRPKKSISCAALQDDNCRQQYAELVPETWLNGKVVSIDEDWKRMTRQLLGVVCRTLGHERGNLWDWVWENGKEIESLLNENNRNHKVCLRDASSVQHRHRFVDLSSIAQSRLRKLENDC